MNKGTQLIIILALLLICTGFVFFVSGVEYTIECTRPSGMCEMRERALTESESSLTGQFSITNAIELSVVHRTDDLQKLYYDILVDYGKNGKYFTGFSFNTLIKANTAKMSLKSFADNSNRQKVVVKKVCYFNKYWCL